MSSPRSIVYIVDDDPSVLKALARLVKTAGYRVKTYNRASAFLDDRLLMGPKCLILDLQMPDLDGLSLQCEMAARGYALPLIFLTGQGSVHSSVKAMQAGALDFLTKPVRAAVLLETVRMALDKNRTQLKADRKLEAIRSRFELLSPREYEVMRWVISGKLSKQIAGELGISIKTVKFHRMILMHKMRVNSVAELTILADRVGIRPMKKFVS